MIFDWFNAREAEKIASDLADQFAPRARATAGSGRAQAAKDGASGLQDLLRRANTDGRLAGLNFYKKARFANSFKWRLLENGVEPGTADSLTHSLVVHLSRGTPTPDEQPAVGDANSAPSDETHSGISCDAAIRRSPAAPTKRRLGLIGSWSKSTPLIPRL